MSGGECVGVGGVLTLVSCRAEQVGKERLVMSSVVDCSMCMCLFTEPLLLLLWR